MANPELESYRRQFQEIRSQAAELTAGLREDQFNWRPAVGEWSIEECLAHLTMVGDVEVRAIEAAIQDAKKRGLKGQGPFEYSTIDRYILHLTEPPVRTPLPAPKQFVPLHGQPVTAILPTFNHIQSQFLIQIDEAEGLDLRRIKVPLPISRFLRMSLGMTFAQIAAHERRHLDQAKRVRARLNL